MHKNSRNQEKYSSSSDGVEAIFFPYSHNKVKLISLIKLITDYYLHTLYIPVQGNKHIDMFTRRQYDANCQTHLSMDIKMFRILYFY